MYTTQLCNEIWTMARTVHIIFSIIRSVYAGRGNVSITVVLLFGAFSEPLGVLVFGFAGNKLAKTGLNQLNQFQLGKSHFLLPSSSRAPLTDGRLVEMVKPSITLGFISRLSGLIH